jgi:hypothetical protein
MFGKENHIEVNAITTADSAPKGFKNFRRKPSKSSVYTSVYNTRKWTY